jgi:AbrB family looped-hinge helix DNA binding protein
VKVDGKGRVVIPTSIRTKLGFGEGAQLTVDVQNDGIVLLRIAIGIEEQQNENEGLEDFLTDS